MEKALNVMYALREAVSLSKNYPSDEILDEAIAELEEAMKPKTCDGCKWNVQVGDVGHFHCWKSRELHYCQANCFIDYCNEFEPKDNA